MTKSKILTLSLILMIVLNVVLVFFMLRGGPSHQRPEGPKQIIIERLHFDATQAASYEVLIKTHRLAIIEKEKQMHAVKAELYSLLSNEDRGNSGSLLAQLGTIQEEMEQLHFEHFLEIGMLCREEQRAAFKDLSQELMELFNGKPKMDRP